jgi:Holliday junction DNA helicase RuvA
MISGLRGNINRFGASRLYLEVSGVEYEVIVPLNVFEKLQLLGTGEEVFIYIHHQFLQDEQRLYGFLEKNQRDLFSAIQNIKGMGSVLSLSILSHLSASQLISLCENKDITALCKIPRVGKSTAETLVFEISRKMDRWKKLLASSEKESVDFISDTDDELVMQALVQLGYKDTQIRSTLEKIKKEISANDLNLSISDKIHRCLQII